MNHCSKSTMIVGKMWSTHSNVDKSSKTLETSNRWEIHLSNYEPTLEVLYVDSCMFLIGLAASNASDLELPVTLRKSKRKFTSHLISHCVMTVFLQHIMLFYIPCYLCKFLQMWTRYWVTQVGEQLGGKMLKTRGQWYLASYSFSYMKVGYWLNAANEWFVTAKKGPEKPQETRSTESNGHG